MVLLRAGRFNLNLDFLIMTEDIDKPPGLRVTMLPGKEVELFGDDAKSLKRQLDEVRTASKTLRGIVAPNLAIGPEKPSGGRGKRKPGT